MRPALPIAAALVFAGFAAPAQAGCASTWNGGVSCTSKRTGAYTFVAPPPAQPVYRDGSPKRLHCTRTGKTTTCLWW